LDRNWVASILRDACGHARVPHQDFINGVLAGLEVGRKQYGEFAYRGRNNNKEGRYEARDCAAYALMEMADMQEEYKEGKVDEQVMAMSQQHLLQVVVMAAQIDQHFALARHYRLS